MGNRAAGHSEARKPPGPFYLPTPAQSPIEACDDRHSCGSQPVYGSLSGSPCNERPLILQTAFRQSISNGSLAALILTKGIIPKPDGLDMPVPAEGYQTDFYYPVLFLGAKRFHPLCSRQ